MLKSIIFFGAFSIAAVSASLTILNEKASRDSRDERGRGGWNKLLQGAGLFDENMNNIQVKSEANLVILEQLRDLLSQDDILDNVYTNYRKTFKDLNAAVHLNKDLFKAQLHKIAAHNLEANSGKHSWWMAVNQFTDMGGVSEIRKMSIDSNQQPTNVTNNPFIPESGVDLPASKNYPVQGFVSSVRDSKGGASGAFFAAAAVVDSAFSIKNHFDKGISGSVQQLVDCVPSFCASQFHSLCQGSQVESNLNLIKISGLILWNQYPYNNPPSVGDCKQLEAYTGLNGNNPFQIYGPNSDVALMQLLVQRGPVVLGLYFSNEMIQSYEKGVYTGSDCGDNARNQDVTLVGYSTESGQYYWLIRNSWGRFWGNQGFLKLVKNGNNNCQVLQSAISVNPA